MKKNEIINYLKEALASEMGCSIGDIDANTSFFKLGVTSVKALKIVNKMKKELNIDINPVVIFKYKHIEELADFLYDEVKSKGVV